MPTPVVVLRVENIPIDCDRAKLQQDIRSLATYAPNELKEALRRAKIRSLARRDSRYASATLAVATSAPREDIRDGLQEAVELDPSDLNYRFDLTFFGITPLYEQIHGLDVCE